VVLGGKTEIILDRAFGEKLTISLTRFAEVTGLAKATLEDYVVSGTLKAISSKAHIHISRPMAVEFLTKGGGMERPTADGLAAPSLPPLKRAAMRFAAKYRKKQRPS
jgi:hypothetical protein